MRAATFGLVWLLVVFGPAGVLAADVLSFRVPEFIPATAGQDTMATIQVSVKRGYHVQANPVKNPSLVPIVLDVKPDEMVVPGPPVYPLSKKLRLDGSDEDLAVYDGTFVIRLPLRVAPDAQRSRLILSGTLRYQACDDRYCLFPVTLPVKLIVLVRR
jgi:hypothetical protein